MKEEPDNSVEMYNDSDDEYISSETTEVHCAKHYFLCTDSKRILDWKVNFFTLFCVSDEKLFL